MNLRETKRFLLRFSVIFFALLGAFFGFCFGIADEPLGPLYLTLPLGLIIGGISGVPLGFLFYGYHLVFKPKKGRGQKKMPW